MTATDFEQLATSLGEPLFDLMLVGDGSGTEVQTPCGWACQSYWRPSGQVKEHYGAASGGTSNFAELWPYVHVLSVFHAARNKNGASPPPPRVLIVSDSELTCRCGDGTYSRKANLSLWAAIDCFVQLGYSIRWRHVPRNSNPLSKASDKTAGRLRKMMT